MARTFVAGVLLVLAALLAISTNLIVWANRTVFDSDEFVATVEPVLRDEDVQAVMSERLSQELYAQADVEDRIRQELPPRLTFLAIPLTTTTQDIFERAVLRVLASELAGEVSERLLLQIHTQVMEFVEGDESGVIERQNNQIIVNLRPLLENAADELGVDQDGQIGQRIDIPEDAGQVVLFETPGTYTWVGDLVKNRQEIAWGFVALTLVLFGLAILAIRNHRAGLRNAGIVLAAAAVITLVALFVAVEVIASYARNPDVADSSLETLLRGLQYQSLTMLAIGGVVAVGAALAGPSTAARSFRGVFRPSMQRGERARTFQGFAQEQQGLLRIVGFGIAALALVLWPDPSTRVYVMILVLLAVYMLALTTLASDANWAVSARTRISDTWSRYFAPPEETHSPGSWISVHANLLMAVGVALAILFLLVSPDLTMRRFVVVLALTFVYLAAIEWMSRRHVSAP